MRRCHGYRALPGLWVTLRTLTDKQNDIDSTTEVA
jgi:hypothetical protein